MDVEKASATPTSPVSCTIQVRGHRLVQDKPSEMGGQNEGPMASELLLGSLLACQLSTFHKVAAKRRNAIAARRIDGEVHFDSGGDIDHVQVAWVLEREETAADADDDAGDGAAQTLLRLAERACTVSKALAVPVRATYSWA